MFAISLTGTYLLLALTFLNDVGDFTRHQNSQNAIEEESTRVFKNGFDVKNSLPKGYVKDGSVDYTSYIQTAIDKYENIIFPNFPLLVNDIGLTIGSNKTIFFSKGSEIRLKPSFKKTYAILNIKNAKNVTLHNPIIIGDRYSHRGNTGEWGMGIRINGSSNINVFGAKVTECWGDGIYIGQSNGINSKDVYIKDAHLSKNRRDGISIIGVNGLVLENIYAGFQDGTKPMCGINFETNNSLCEIKNVRVINPKTEHNKGSGIQIGLSTMVGGANKFVDIVIINHIDIGSKVFAVKVACNRKSGVLGGGVKGTVKIINPVWNSTVSGIPLSLSTNQADFTVQVSSPTIKNTNGTVLNSIEAKKILSRYNKTNIEFPGIKGGK